MTVESDQLEQITEVLDGLASYVMAEGLPLTSHLISVAAESIRSGHGKEPTPTASIRSAPNGK